MYPRLFAMIQPNSLIAALYTKRPRTPVGSPQPSPLTAFHTEKKAPVHDTTRHGTIAEIVLRRTVVVRLVDASQGEHPHGRVRVDVSHEKREYRHVDDARLRFSKNSQNTQ